MEVTKGKVEDLFWYKIKRHYKINQEKTKSKNSESDVDRQEWPEKRFHTVYALIFIYTVLLIFLIWFFPRAFD